MKKLWGIVVCVMVMCGGAVAGLLHVSGGVATRVQASDFPQLQDIRINVSDDNMVQGGVNLFNNIVGYVHTHANGYRQIINNPNQATWTPAPANRPNVPVVGFDVYGGFGAQTFRSAGTNQHSRFSVSVDFGRDFMPVSYRFEIDAPPEAEVDRIWHNTQHWSNVRIWDEINGTERTTPYPAAPQRLGSVATDIDRITFGQPGVGGHRFDMVLEGTGIYEFQITAAQSRSVTNGVLVHVDPERIRANTSQEQFRFVVVVRAEPPRFASVMSQVSRFAFDRRVIVEPTTLPMDDVLTVGFYYAGGFNAPAQSARFVGNNGGAMGLPEFLTARRVAPGGVDSEGNNIPQLLEIGLREGHTATAGQFGARRNANNQWVVYPPEAITVRIEFPAFNDVALDGIIRPTGSWYVDEDSGAMVIRPTGQHVTWHEVALQVGFVFTEPPAGRGFQYWFLVGGVAALLALAGGFVLVNKFATTIQMRDVRKKRNKEELSDMKKYENMKRMRREATEAMDNDTGTGASGGRDEPDDDGIN